jgi:hypothetical protein
MRHEFNRHKASQFFIAGAQVNTLGGSFAHENLMDLLWPSSRAESLLGADESLHLVTGAAGDGLGSSAVIRQSVHSARSMASHPLVARFATDTKIPA